MLGTEQSNSAAQEFYLSLIFTLLMTWVLSTVYIELQDVRERLGSVLRVCLLQHSQFQMRKQKYQE